MRAALWLAVAGVACNSAHAITADAPVADAYQPIDATLAVTSLEITPSTVALTWPLSQPLMVTAYYTDDSIMDVSVLATFTSDTPSVAEVSAGTVQSVGPGSATITVSYSGVSTTIPVTVTAPTLAVASPDGVDLFYASATGSATPLRSIRGSATTIVHACGVAELGGELFVADDGANAIDVWAVTASGNVAPDRVISTSFTPVSIASDGTSIYVGASDGVSVFAPAASGAATPLQTITGSATTIANAAGIAVYQGELYVVDQAGSVPVFPRTANGNVAPTREIGGAATGLDMPVGIAVGQSLEFVTDATPDGQVQVYSPQSGGDAAPIGNFSGADAQLVTPTSAAVTQTVVFVGTPSTQSIEVLLVGDDNGEFPPYATITGVNVQGMTIF